MSLVGLIASASPAAAQTSTWSSTASGNWSTAGDWSGGTAPAVGGSSTQTITFSAAATSAITSTVDSGIVTSSAFDLTTLNLSSLGSSAGSVTIAAASGDKLAFTGTANAINFNNSTGTYNITSSISYTNGLTVSLAGGELGATITGNITGTGTLLINNQTSNNAAQFALNGAGNSIGTLAIGTVPTQTTSRVSIINGGNGAGAGTVILGTAGELVVNGGGTMGTGTLQLAGGTLTYGGESVGGVLTVANAVQLYNSSQFMDSTNIQGSAQLKLTGAINLENSDHVLTIDNQADSSIQNTLISGVVSNGTLVKSGPGLLILSGANTYAGGTEAVRGNLQFNSNTAVPASGTISLFGAGSLNTTQVGTTTAGAESGTVMGWLNSGKIASNSNGSIDFSSTSGTSNEAINFAGYNSLMLGSFVNQTTTYTGTITPGTNGYNLGGGTLLLSNADALTGSNAVNIGSLGLPLALNGGNAGAVTSFASTGTVTLNNSNDASGPTTVNAQVLDLTGSSSNTLGALPNSAVSVLSNATLAIDNANVTSLSGPTTRASSLSLDGATMTVAGTAAGNSNDAITNGITLANGYSSIKVTPNAATSAELSAASLSSTGGVALVNGVNLGLAAPGTAGDANIILTTAPTLTGAGTTSGGVNNAQQNTGIVPYLVGEASATAGTASGTANTFLTYDGTTGLRPLSSGEFKSNSIVAGDNTLITSATAVASPTSINSLVMAGSAATTLTINNGETLTDASGAILFTESGDTIAPGSSSGVLAFGSNTAYISTNSGVTGSITAAISGSGGITKFGAGALVINNASNNYSGNVTVENGSLTISSANAASTGITTVLSGTLTVGNANALGTGNTSAVLVGDTSGTNVTGINLSAVSLNRNITLQSGNIGVTTLAAGTATSGIGFTGTLTLGSSGATGRNVTLTGGSAGGFTGVIQDPASLVAGTAGIVTYSPGSTSPTTVGEFGNVGNTYSGGTVLNVGTMSVGTGGTGSFFGTGLIVINGNTQFNQQTASATVTGTNAQVWNSDFGTTTSAFGLNFATTGSIDLGASGNSTVRTVTVGSTGTLSEAGAIVNGSNGLTTSLTKAGAGTLVAYGANTYTGTTTISAGTFQLGNSGTTGSLASGGTIVDNGQLTINETGTVTQGSQFSTAAISGTGSVTQAGSGATGLIAANTYSGGTTVNAGTLLVNNTVAGGSATGSGAVTVNAGGTIGGAGTSSGTALSISGTGTATAARANVLAGLNSVSDTNTSQVLTLKAPTASIASANLTFNINDQVAGGLGTDPANSGTELNVGNTAITFGAGQQSTILTLNVQNAGIIGAFTPYVLIAGDTTGAFDQYTGLSLGSGTVNGTVTITPILNSGNNGTGNVALSLSGLAASYYGSNSYLFLYQDSSTGADDIEVEVVPEPGTWALMAGGLAMLVFWQRRKSRNN